MYTFDSPWVHHPCSSQAVVEGARDGVTTTTSRHPPQNIQYAKTRHLLSTVRRRRERQLVYEHANARPTLCLTIIHWGESHLSLSLSLARAPGGPATAHSRARISRAADAAAGRAALRTLRTRGVGPVSGQRRIGVTDTACAVHL